jgi:hypothetical protein
MGFFVIMTGIMAFISGSYAISNMFLHANPINGKPIMAPTGWLISFVIGLVYACFIMAIDREIVSSNTRWAAAIRIPLAIVISLIVSVPVELQIFDARINKHLLQSHIAENDNLRSKLESRNRLKEIESAIDQVERQKIEATEKRNYWAEAIEAEVVGRVRDGRTGKAGKGLAYEEAMMNKNIQENLIVKYDIELRDKNIELKNIHLKEENEFSNEKVQQSYDLLSKYIALNEIKIEDKSGSASHIGLGIALLFCLFELIPSLMKLFLPQTEYDMLLDKRRRLNMHAAKIIFQQNYSEYEGLNSDEI